MSQLRVYALANVHIVCNGLGIGYLGAMYTLNTIDRHIAAICGGEPFRPAYIRRV